MLWQQCRGAYEVLPVRTEWDAPFLGIDFPRNISNMACTFRPLFSTGLRAMPFPAKVSPQSRRKKLILCIDHHQPGVRARKLILEAAGYRVLTANSGTIGLRLLRRHRVHFVVLDYRMPQMDGEAVAREIRRIDPHTPVIMLSGQIQLAL